MVSPLCALSAENVSCRVIDDSSLADQREHVTYINSFPAMSTRFLRDSVLGWALRSRSFRTDRASSTRRRFFESKQGIQAVG